MPFAGLDELAVRLTHKIFAEAECYFEGSGAGIGTTVGSDANHGG